MGARTNIEIKFANEPSIYIYSHWGGEGGLRQDLRRAISRRQRWNDEQYLTAIILREVLRDNLDKETSVGVAPYPGEEEYTTTVVDIPSQTVDGIPFAAFCDEHLAVSL
jgi:hypothetical protein